jgi:phage terminase large subunit
MSNIIVPRRTIELASNRLKLPYNFELRDYQKGVFQALFFQLLIELLLIWPRRAGKDAVLREAILAYALKRKGFYLYLFPFATQLRKVIWRGIDEQGNSFIDSIPKQILACAPNNQELFLTLINGSIIQFAGTDNFDSLRGVNCAGVFMSETADHNPRIFDVIRPILLRSGGPLVCNGTPKGKNHWYDMYMASRYRSDVYTSHLTIDMIKDNEGKWIFSQEQIESERQKGVPEEIIRQEYYCDFNVGVQGAYYTKNIQAAHDQGRILDFPIPQLPVWTFWDIGVSNATAIWFVQPNGSYLDLIYYIEKTDEGPDYFAKELARVQRELGIEYRGHFGPHDLRQRRWGYSARSSLQLAAAEGINFNLVPEVGFDNGIQAVRALFKQCRFHAKNCSHGIRGLTEYRREWNEVDKVFKDTPKKNWATDCADAFRYFCVYWTDALTRPEDHNAPRTYSVRY